MEFKFVNTSFSNIEFIDSKDRLYVIDSVTYHVRAKIKAKHTYKKLFGISYNNNYDNYIAILFYRNDVEITRYVENRKEFLNKKFRLCLGVDGGFMINSSFYEWDDYISSVINKHKEEWKKFYI